MLLIVGYIIVYTLYNQWLYLINNIDKLIRLTFFHGVSHLIMDNVVSSIHAENVNTHSGELGPN